jgi:hypothetical protein
VYPPQQPPPPPPPTTTMMTTPNELAMLQRSLFEMTRQRDQTLSRCKQVERENEELQDRLLRASELSHAYESLQKVSPVPTSTRHPPHSLTGFGGLHFFFVCFVYFAGLQCAPALLGQFGGDSRKTKG